ncbi:MAG TPA: hypothetical protein VLW84_13345 [Terriglobales bacterium]|nr:hypothetical protein [Terriglobales bacterium]
MGQLGWSNGRERQSNYESGGSRKSWWSDHVPEVVAGSVLLGFVLVVISCSKFGEKNKAAAISAPSVPAAMPAALPIANSPAAETKPEAKKPRKHRPTTATYVNPDYGVSLTFPRKYKLLVGEEARLKWNDLGPVETDFANSGGMTLAAIELPTDLFPDTDLNSAFINVSVKTGLTNEQCAKFAFPGEATAPASPKKIIGSNEFVQATEFNEQATAQAEAKYYHLFQNGACYEFGLGVGTTGDDSDPKIAQVDREQVFDRLEKILETVKIKPANVPATEGPVETQVPAQKVSPAETLAPGSQL